MRAERFEYARFGHGRAPVVPVDVRFGNRWNRVWAYVDSGARFSVFRAEEAKRFGLRLSDCRRERFKAAGGRLITVHLKRLTLKIGLSRFRADVGFSKDLGGTVNLLGRQGLFDRFEVCFNDRHGIIRFQPLPRR